MDYLSTDQKTLSFSKSQLAKCTIIVVPSILNYDKVSYFTKDRREILVKMAE